jgi:HK97 family phage major capsid protein
MTATIDAIDFLPSQSAEVDRLRRIRATTRDAAEQLLRDHADADGNLSAQHQREFDRLMTEWETKGAPLGKRLTIEAINGGRSLGQINSSIRHGIDPRSQANDSGGLSYQHGKLLHGRVFDDRGRAIRALTRDESFAAAHQEYVAITGESDGTEKLVRDGLDLGSLCRALAIGPKNAVERAALSGGNSTAGGYTVPEYLSSQVIDLLRAKLVLGRAGMGTIPIEGDTRFARLTGDATPAWRQEGTAIAESEPTFGAFDIVPRSLGVIVRATRELLEDSPNVDQMIRRSLSQGFAHEVDAKGLFGVGAAAEPLGITNWDGIGEVSSVGAIADYSEVISGLLKLMDANSADPTALILSNREFAKYAGLVDTTDQPLMRPKAIENLPFLATSAIPINLGGGSNESIAVLADFTDFAMAIRSEMTIQVLTEYYATTYEFGFLAHLRLDFLLMHAGSVCKLTGITP